VVKVKSEDVEIRVRDKGPLDLNSGELAIEIDSGPGSDGWRLVVCADILREINAALAPVVPERLRRKGSSNMWLRVFTGGASTPIGCPKMAH